MLPGTVNPWSIHPLAITSIDYVKRPEVMRSLEGLIWDLAVLDEAHHLIGRSDRADAAAMLGDRARALVMLTATPHSGDDAAFARLCTLGDADGSAPLLAFRRTRADVGLHGQRRAPLLRIRPTAAEAAMHEALMAYASLVWNQPGGSGLSGARLAVSVLARRACSSAGSLARSIERRLAILNHQFVPQESQRDLPFAFADAEDDEPQAVLQPAGLPDEGDERRRLERLLELARRAAKSGESKIVALQRFLSRVDEPAIVFTEYRDTLQRLADALPPLDAVQLHGGLSPRERAEVTRRFTRGSVRLLLATDAGSEGLNLHHRCRLVINLELPWTPLRLEQRAGRVDRIGQQRRAHAVHLVAAGTCEETTLARLALRVRRIHGALSLLARMPDAARVAESILGRHTELDALDDPPRYPPALRMGSAPGRRRIRYWSRGAGGSTTNRAGARPIYREVCRSRPRTPGHYSNPDAPPGDAASMRLGVQSRVRQRRGTPCLGSARADWRARRRDVPAVGSLDTRSSEPRPAAPPACPDAGLRPSPPRPAVFDRRGSESLDRTRT